MEFQDKLLNNAVCAGDWIFLFETHMFQCGLEISTRNAPFLATFTGLLGWGVEAPPQPSSRLVGDEGLRYESECGEAA